MVTRSHPLVPSTPSQHASGAVLHHPWTHIGTRIAATAGATVTSGLAAAVIVPRGPVTSTQAILLMAIALGTVYISLVRPDVFASR